MASEFEPKLKNALDIRYEPRPYSEPYRTGLTMGAVRRYWRNEVTSVPLDALDKLAALLGVEPGDLIGRGERKQDDRDGR